ncbi:MAG: hypothetical protein WC054_03755 [Candidatus Nanopelagicales bacterium]
MADDSPVESPEDLPPMTMAQARMLDLRTYICALFAIFGVTVTILGFFATPAELEKAAGMNINLYAGLSMVALSVVMGVWAIVVPPELPEPTTTPEQLPLVH